MTLTRNFGSIYHVTSNQISSLSVHMFYLKCQLSSNIEPLLTLTTTKFCVIVLKTSRGANHPSLGFPKPIATQWIFSCYIIVMCQHHCMHHGVMKIMLTVLHVKTVVLFMLMIILECARKTVTHFQQFKKIRHDSMPDIVTVNLALPPVPIKR